MLRLAMIDEGPVHYGLHRCCCLVQGEALELCGESCDLSVELPGTDGVHGLLHRRAVLHGDLAEASGPFKGGGGTVVSLGDLGPAALLEHELLLGEEVVGVDLVELPDLVQQTELDLGVKAQVADELADMGPVLLLDMGAIVLVARPRAREGDLVLEAVGEQVGVDELAAVVGVDPDNREGELATDALDRLEDPDGSLVLHRPVDRPNRGDVGARQGEAEFATRVAPFVADEVDLDKAWPVLDPLGPGADGDLRLEQGAGLCVATPPGHKASPGGTETGSMEIGRAHV